MESIESLGEFGLIERIAKTIKIKQPTTKKGIGDDCAVLDTTDGCVKVVTTDLLLEGIHFDLTYCPLKHLGYKAVAVNLSDVCAMNARPQQITVSIGVSGKFTLKAIDDLYDGIRAACDRYGVDIVGGDTTSSLTGLTISITAIGEQRTGHLAYRDGARENDIVCVSGNLGAAYMGLQLLEREKKVLKGDTTSQPALKGYEYILERQLKPEPRTDIVDFLEKIGVVPTSMMDVSDGLSSELMHICEQSGCGCRVYEKNIPIDYQTAVMAEEMNMNVTTCALNGGEDYELLFTVPIGDLDKVRQLDDVKLIGNITKKEYGLQLVARDGNEFELKAQGWNPLA